MDTAPNAVRAVPAEHPIRLGDAEIAAFLASQSGLVIVDVTAEWCMPCRLLRPILRKLALEFRGRAAVVELDADTADGFKRAHDVDAFPTLLFFVNGAVVRREVGFKDAAAAREVVVAALGVEDDGQPSPAERAFREACAKAEARLDEIMTPASRALDPCMDEIVPLMEAFEASLTKELDAGRISQTEFNDRVKAEFVRLRAPFQDKFDALTKAQGEAVAAYEATMEPAIAAFGQELARGGADRAARAKACRPDDPFCAI